MAPSPRFRRVAALQRRFVDREPVLASFAAELAAAGAGPRVLNVTGVGGIGKSRLLHELRSRASAGNRTGNLDLQIPALRRQEDALAVLRGQLGAQGAHFDRFDLAYAVLWQRLHPHLRLSRSELSFVSDSSVLTDIVDTVAGLPVFGTAQGLLKLLDRGRSDVRRRLRVRRDPTLQTLDELPNGDLTDAVTYLFAEDLRACSDATPFVRVGALDGLGVAERSGEPVVGAVDVERFGLGPQSPDDGGRFGEAFHGVGGVVEGQTRADLIVAVYRHQVEACAEAGPRLLANSGTPHTALARWINLFVDFLVTKHGLAEALQSDDDAFESLHAYFLDRLVPVCAELLDAAATAGEIRPGTDAYELMRAVGSLCVGADNDPRYDPRRMVELLIAGLCLR